MNADRVRRLLMRAAELDSAEQPAFLDAECGGDAALRAEVTSLLVARTRMGGFLEQPAVAASPLTPGEVVGAYEVVREIGHGGSGSVYEAWQSRPRRKVALKVMRCAGANRFAEEAEILGRLKHPGIAHVYEAGVHEGRPFLALEYVEGARALTDFAAGLGLRARLSLLARVCDAVHHGHQKGVIHCDLKPGNLLVDEAGRPKVIDFGIARLAGDEGPRARVGTPPYMSPEQHAAEAGEAPDVRADVYALGVLLAEIAGGGSEDVRAIVRCATQPDRDRRYASMSALADDLRRCLAYFPVEARGGGVLYQASRFARRHLVVCTLLCALLVVSVTAAVVGGRLAIENARARARAERQAYAAGIAAADAALRGHDLAEARERLRRTPRGLRGWEWRYLVAGLDQSVRTIHAPELGVRAVYTPDGRYIVAACGHPHVNRAVVCVFDAESGAEISRRDVGAWVFPLRFGGDGLVWGTGRGAVMVVDPVSLKTVRGMEFQEPAEDSEEEPRPEGIGAIDVTHGRIVTHRAKDVVTRSLADGVLLDRLYRGEFAWRAACFAGGRLVIALDDFVDVWKLAEPGGGKPAATRLPVRGPVSALATTRDGRWIACGLSDGRVSVFRDLTPFRTVRRGEDVATALLWDEDGSRLTSGHRSGRIVVWNVASGRESMQVAGHAERVTELRRHPGTGHLLSSAMDGTMRVWPDAPLSPRYLLATPPRLVRDVAYSPDGRFLACACFDGAVRVYDPRTGARVGVLEIDGKEWVGCVAYSPDGKRLAVGSNDGKVRIWDPATARVRATLKTDPGRPNGIAFSPSGKWLACGDTECTLTVWEAATGDVAFRARGNSWMRSPCFSPDGRSIAAADGGTLRVWSVPEWRERLRVAAHEDATAVAFHPRRDVVATASHDGALHYWDAKSGKRILTRTVHDVAELVFSPDGRRLIACGRGLHVLDGEDAEPLLHLRGTKGRVLGAAFSPDGAQLATGEGGYAGVDCAVRLWGRTPGLSWPPAPLTDD